MNVKILPNKGCALLACGNPNNGYWKIGGLASPVPLLIKEVAKAGQDTVGKTVCFNNIRSTAIISKGFGEIQINCIALIGEVTEQKAFESYLQNFINSNRSSNSGKMLKLSSKSGTASNFLLTGYKILGPDSEFNIFSFILVGTLYD